MLPRLPDSGASLMLARCSAWTNPLRRPSVRHTSRAASSPPSSSCAATFLGSRTTRTPVSASGRSHPGPHSRPSLRSRRRGGPCLIRPPSLPPRPIPSLRAPYRHESILPAAHRLLGPNWVHGVKTEASLCLQDEGLIQAHDLGAEERLPYGLLCLPSCPRPACRSPNAIG